MVTLIAGKKGSGKSKEIVKLANDAVSQMDGSAIFIDDDKRAMYDLHHNLRFINLQEFPIETGDAFLGFICGLISNNYDTQKIYIDGILNCVKMDIDHLPNFFEKVDKISTGFNVDFITTLSYEYELPESLKKYIK